MTKIPAVVAPAPREKAWNRHLAPSAAFSWLAAGWRDLTTQPLASLGYGALVFLVSVAVVVGLFGFGWDYILFPAFAQFMVVGPVLAVGLYEKSRRIAAGEPVGLADMIFVRPKSGGQILFTGVLLCLLMLVWMRAVVIIYALFFGLLPFPASVKSCQCCSPRPLDGQCCFSAAQSGGCSPLSLSPLARSRSLCCSMSGSMPSQRWERAPRWFGTTSQ